MHLCFVLSPSREPLGDPNTERITGRNGMLEIFRSPKSGPWYPHLAEKTDEDSYRFFAGRIAGVVPSRELPARHAVALGDARQWDFPGGEPDGNWLALKFDRRKDCLSIASDLCILQRWFYTQIGSRWCVSNSLVHLHHVLGGALDLEQRAVPYIVLFSHLPWQYTPLKDVFSLLSGEVLVVEAGRGELVPRAELPLVRPADAADTPPMSEAEAAAVADQVLVQVREAVARELEHVPSVILPLSGGMDSRFLLGCALECLPREAITAVTFGLPASLDLRLGTALARDLRLPHRTLPADRRSYPELLTDGFRPAEGIYWAVPTYPSQPLREALAPGTLVLSGYLGESVSGSFDLSGPELAASDQSERRLFEIAVGMTLRADFEEVVPLLTDPQWDLLGYEESLRRLAGTFEERYDRWLWANYLLNCGNFELMLHRDRAFYLTPYVHPTFMRFCYRLPRTLRQRQQVFFTAMKRGFPDLYRFPTKRNFGFPPESPRLPVLLARAGRKLRSSLDDALWRATGRFAYPHPHLNYEDPREISLPEHRAAVLGSLEELDSLSVFNTRGLSRLRDRYRGRGNVNPHLLWGLLTVHQWMIHYRRTPRTA